MSDQFPPACSMWRLRDPGSLKGQWKITARYGCCFKDDVWLDCVRVSYFGRSVYLVRHYVVTEFLRLFIMVGPDHLLPKPSLQESLT